MPVISFCTVSFNGGVWDGDHDHQLLFRDRATAGGRGGFAGIARRPGEMSNISIGTFKVTFYNKSLAPRRPVNRKICRPADKQSVTARHDSLCPAGASVSRHFLHFFIERGRSGMGVLRRRARR